MMKNILSIAKCKEENELLSLVQAVTEGKRGPIICYSGFEPSGRLTLAQSLMTVNTLIA